MNYDYKIPLLVLLGISLIALTLVPSSFATTSTDLYSCDKNLDPGYIHLIDKSDGTIISSEEILGNDFPNSGYAYQCLDLTTNPTTGQMYAIE